MDSGPDVGTDSGTDIGARDIGSIDTGSLACEATGFGGASCIYPFTDPNGNPSPDGVCAVDRGGGDGGSPDGGTPADAGSPQDGGGATDATPPPPPCIDGAEGCACVSTFTETSTVFAQDDCDNGLLCVPFEVTSGRQAEVTGPNQTCVRPCLLDTDCGPGRFCTDMGLTSVSGGERFCVDRIARVDEFCGFSRTTDSVLPDVEVRTPGEIVGCAGSLTCQVGFFADVHPDEGACIEFCTAPGDCAAPTPYCNPLFSAGSTTTFGVCSFQPLGIGALCGPIDSDGIGIVNQCDATVPNVACVGVQGLFPERTGFCAQGCSTTSTCTESDPNLGAYTCTPFPGGAGEGFCTVDCSNFPENCAGPGSYGFGRMCYDQLVLGGPMPEPVEFCMDRLGPPQEATLLTSDGMGIGIQGGNCQDPSDPLSFARCEEGTFCTPLQPDLGACFFGCQ